MQRAPRQLRLLQRQQLHGHDRGRRRRAGQLVSLGEWSAVCGSLQLAGKCIRRGRVCPCVLIRQTFEG